MRGNITISDLFSLIEGKIYGSNGRRTLEIIQSATEDLNEARRILNKALINLDPSDKKREKVINSKSATMRELEKKIKEAMEKAKAKESI